MKILVVEDAPLMFRIIKNTLQNVEAAEIYEAKDGLDAQTLIKRNDFDLVITDWIMPELDGLELVKWIRTESSSKSIPIIMITTKGMKIDILNAIKARVDGYIVKPIQPQLLIDKIKEVMRKTEN